MARKTESPDQLSLLKRELKEKNLGRLYFFYGEESFLRSHYLAQVRKQLLERYGYPQVACWSSGQVGEVLWFTRLFQEGECTGRID